MLTKYIKSRIRSIIQKISDKYKKEEMTVDDSHLEDIPDGSGCTEIWEHISESDKEKK